MPVSSREIPASASVPAFQAVYFKNCGAQPPGSPACAASAQAGVEVPSAAFCISENALPCRPAARRKAAPRKTGAPDEPGFGLAGWDFAPQQIVILNERRSRE